MRAEAWLRTVSSISLFLQPFLRWLIAILKLWSLIPILTGALVPRDDAAAFVSVCFSTFSCTSKSLENYLLSQWSPRPEKRKPSYSKSQRFCSSIMPKEPLWKCWRRVLFSVFLFFYFLLLLLFSWRRATCPCMASKFCKNKTVKRRKKKDEENKMEGL